MATANMSSNTRGSHIYFNMFNSKALSLYLYMGNASKVIEILKAQGIKTRSEARNFLSPYISGVMTEAVILGGTWAGLANGAGRILDAFPEKKLSKKVKIKRAKH